MRTVIIAEIGINHNGDIGVAKRLIEIARVAGCDYVKFQKRNPDVCVPEAEKTKLRETPWGTMTYIEYKHRLEFGQSEFDEISDYCDRQGIKWTASVWDIDSVHFMRRYSPDFIKVPSALITDHVLLDAVVEFFPSVVISTGMSTEAEIHSAVMTVENAWIRKFGKKPEDHEFVIMHCNSTYPAPLNELNLAAISSLRRKFGYTVGYSGHEFRIGTTVASIFLGAEYIERHITLDRSAWGTDQLSSVEPQGLMKLVSGVRELEKALGSGDLGLTESQVPVRQKLRPISP